MTVTLGPLVVDPVEPRIIQTFWAAALGEAVQSTLLSFRVQQRAKTVKNRFVRVDDERVAPNRWKWSVYAERGPNGDALLDPQGNEYSVRP